MKRGLVDLIVQAARRTSKKSPAKSKGRARPGTTDGSGPRTSAGAYLAAVIESSDDAIITKDLNGTITSWNRGAERIFGYTPKEAIGRHITMIIPEERRREESEILRRLRSGERIDHFETIRRAKDGRLLNISITVSPIKDDRGRIVGASKIARDISDRILNERKWKFLTDATTEFARSLDFKETCRSIARIPVPLLADFACLDLLTPEDTVERAACVHATRRDPEFMSMIRFTPLRVSTVHPVSRALATGKPVHVAEVTGPWIDAMAVSKEHARVLKKLGVRSWLTVPLAARGKTLGALTLYLSDPRRRHEAEHVSLAEEYARRASEALENALLYRAAQEAVTEREKFLSIASHELRTPLTTMLLQLQGAIRTLARDGAGVVSKALAQVTTAEKHGARIGKLVSELLDISRITSGKLRLQIEYFDLAELVRSVVENFRPELADKGIEVEVVAPGPVRGRWDRFRIEQVVTNLLSNAIKYGGGKPVTVALESDSKRVKLTVRDRGPGMDPTFMKRIFKPFEQAEESAALGGLGLGLFIARQIVESHGGGIGVTSRPGEGSTFSVELPRAFSLGPGADREVNE